MRIIRVTTNQGIEDIAAREITRLLAAAGINSSEPLRGPGGLKGVVTARVDDDSISPDEIYRVLRQARTIYHVVIHVGELEWRGQSAEALALELAALPLTLMANARTFRASCSRTGEHPFHSPDVEAELGGALQDRYGTAVDLVNYDLNVRVDIVGNRCLCGYQLSGKKGLDRRYLWKYHPRVTLRTTVAAAMLEIAGYAWRPGDLLDPFCGSGTILMEAAAITGAESAVGAERGAGRNHAIVGSDIAERAVSGCLQNLEAAGLSERVAVSRADARDLAGLHPPSSLDYVVTNPPFGIRLAHGADLGALYRDFLGQVRVVLRPGGVLALLVGKQRGRFNRVLQSTGGFTLEHVRIIEIGGVYPGLFVLRREEEQ